MTLTTLHKRREKALYMYHKVKGAPLLINFLSMGWVRNYWGTTEAFPPKQDALVFEIKECHISNLGSHFLREIPSLNIISYISLINCCSILFTIYVYIPGPNLQLKQIWFIHFTRAHVKWSFTLTGFIFSYRQVSFIWNVCNKTKKCRTKSKIHTVCCTVRKF